MPAVTVVPVVAPPPPQPCQLRADTLGFEPDRTDLIDQAAAVAVLRTCLTKLGAARRIEVIGTTSSAGTEEGRAQLSQQRAEVIRDLLGHLGIAESRITARGIGNSRPPCVVDRRDGVLDPVLAAKNRLVIIRAG
jgi:outer membrane protein OmpA-like peptidoglycan-associated protein